MNNFEKKVLFISLFKIDKVKNDGVAKKINYQIDALKDL